MRKRRKKSHLYNIDGDYIIRKFYKYSRHCIQNSSEKLVIGCFWQCMNETSSYTPGIEGYDPPKGVADSPASERVTKINTDR